MTDSPWGVIGIQLLDGVAAGIFGVISIIIAADLMRGTGRFNLAQGLVALSTGLGAGASNFFAGFVVQSARDVDDSLELFFGGSQVSMQSLN